MAFPFMLLAAQAAGIGINMYAQRRAERFTRIGEDLERQQLETRMAEEQTAFTQESLFNVEKLRDVMATRHAMLAARGTSAAQGSVIAQGEKSIRQFSNEERARALSQSFKQNHIKSQMRLYGLNREARRAQRGSQLLNQSLNMFSFNSLGENPFGKTGENYG